jgi:hypothetical protein
MYNASHATMNSQFPLIQQETISRLSAEVDERLAEKTRQVVRPKSSWFIISFSATVLTMGWPFK